MIIEKIAKAAFENAIEKDAIGAIPGAIIGAVRADKLSKDEANEIRDAYGLYPRGGVRNRGAWKGALGAWLGSIPGSSLTLTGINMANSGVTALGLLTSIAGGAVGAKMLTDKYSRAGLERIRYNNRHK